MLKARFLCLRSLPMALNATEELPWALGMVSACVVLHNLLKDSKDDWIPPPEAVMRVLEEERAAQRREYDYGNRADFRAGVETAEDTDKQQKENGQRRRNFLLQEFKDEEEYF